MSSVSAEALHPALWRGSQLGRNPRHCVATGHAALSAVLPGGGWPLGALTELLAARPGIGELRLLQPALARLDSTRRIVLLRPPCVPHAAAWAAGPLPAERLLWLRPERDGDALWAAEQVLKNGSCGALLYWQPQLRAASLRRLHLAAQAHDMLFFLFRHDAAAHESSPAPLRLQLQPAGNDLRIEVVKRRGPRYESSILVPLLPRLGRRAPAAPQPSLPDPLHAPLDQRPSDAAQPRRPAPAQPLATR
ncbi:translesion DNA synthesis-associated protein ImuA [Pigmentiphaga soli]|uniref:Translesion DNA synthesis-associated protein ImuA n=1 Tax=Pigmentiphaga soli TaxID=1007095 RepID=A0ABP8H7D6_9BURK